jgi:hypothetical protein
MFYPTLKRSGFYPTKNDGSYYSYRYYREHIAKDCRHRCVYCDAKEDEVGGAESMQLDHFRPESFPEFENLINDPLNLHYACSRCNLWKLNNWPARGTPHTHDGTCGFVDPFVENRLDYFVVRSDGRIEPLRHPGKYVIGLLHLEREFMRKLREKRLLLAEWQATKSKLRAELQADLETGRRSDPAAMLQFLQISDRIEALIA